MASNYKTVEESVAETYLQIDVLLVGEPGCGKKTIIQTFSQQRLSGEIDFENGIVTTKQFKQQEIEFHIWSTAGMKIDGERSKKLYARADVVVICCSVEELDALDYLEYCLMPEIRRYCSPKAPRVLVLNKKDLYESHTKMIHPVDTNIFAVQIGVFYRINCSAFNIEDVNRIFEAVGKAYYKKIKKMQACTVQ